MAANAKSSSRERSGGPDRRIRVDKQRVEAGGFVLTGVLDPEESRARGELGRECRGSAKATASRDEQKEAER